MCVHRYQMVLQFANCPVICRSGSALNCYQNRKSAVINHPLSPSSRPPTHKPGGQRIWLSGHFLQLKLKLNQDKRKCSCLIDLRTGLSGSQVCSPNPSLSSWQFTSLVSSFANKREQNSTQLCESQILQMWVASFLLLSVLLQIKTITLQMCHTLKWSIRYLLRRSQLQAQSRRQTGMLANIMPPLSVLWEQWSPHRNPKDMWEL